MRFINAFVAACAAMLLGATAFAHDFGPAPGDALPAPLAAADSAGADQDFASLAGANGLVLVFARSADWCPYCQRQLIGLEGVRDEIEAAGWKLAAVTTDTPDQLARFAARRGIGYPLLSDAHFTLVRAYGLTDPAYPEGRRHHGVPVPTVLFVTPDQHVAAKLGDANFRIRPAPEQVVATLSSLSH